MPSIISTAQLRTVLGVSVSLYPDSVLDEIVNTAEAVILPMLVANTSAVESYKLETNVAYFYTVRPHYFVEGQSVIVTGLPAPFSNTFTLAERIGERFFTAALVNADVAIRPIVPNGTATLSGYSAVNLYANSPAIESAVLAVSVEVFQSITAPGNTSAQVDFNPSPFVLGRSLQNRVVGLLAPFIDVETMGQ